MTVKVLRQFKDKHTKVLHKKDSIIEISNERYEEINSTSHGVLVKEIKEDGTPSDYLDKYEGTEDYYNELTKKELTKIAEEKGIKFSSKTTKKEMIKELL